MPDSDRFDKRSCPRLAAAHAARRCLHVKTNGVRCGSPALRKNPFCYFHNLVHNPPYADELPLLEDENAVQRAIQLVLERLLHGRIDTKTAATLLYGLQVASANLTRASFEPSACEVVREHPIARAIRTRRRSKSLPPADQSESAAQPATGSDADGAGL